MFYCSRIYSCYLRCVIYILYWYFNEHISKCCTYVFAGKIPCTRKYEHLECTYSIFCYVNITYIVITPYAYSSLLYNLMSCEMWFRYKLLNYFNQNIIHTIVSN